MLLIKNTLTLSALQKLADERFGDMVKCVVDIEKLIMAAGVALHADAEAALLADGSSQGNLWGINIYVPYTGVESIEFDSMINIRPSSGNRSRSVEDPATQKKIIEYIKETLSS